jgi:hypothetical protein
MAPPIDKERTAADVSVMLKELATVARSHGFERLADLIEAARREARTLARRERKKARPAGAGVPGGNRRAASAVDRGHARGSKMAKRELIDTGTYKRYVRRGERGRFKESDDVGRSLAADRRTKAKTVAKSGQGDKGDRRPRAR